MLAVMVLSNMRRGIPTESRYSQNTLRRVIARIDPHIKPHPTNDSKKVIIVGTILRINNAQRDTPINPMFESKVRGIERVPRTSSIIPLGKCSTRPTPDLSRLACIIPKTHPEPRIIYGDSTIIFSLHLPTYGFISYYS